MLKNIAFTQCLLLSSTNRIKNVFKLKWHIDVEILPTYVLFMYRQTNKKIISET